MRKPSRIRTVVLGLALLVPVCARAATFTIVNLDAAGIGLNDPTPALPVGGNAGTTKGQQALLVFQKAGELWGAQLKSSVEIRVDAHFQPLSCTSSSGTLGSAGPNAVWRDFAGAPRPNTWYVSAEASSLKGSDIDPAGSDINMQFNGAMGTTGCLQSLSWYMGLDTAAPGGTISLLSVALHEMAHGLGFLSLVNLSTGAKIGGFDDAYMRFLERHSTGLLYPAMTDAQRLAASTATGDLHWTGANVLSANGSLSAGVSGGHVEIYAPSPQEQGSSVSHFSKSLAPNDLMEPSYTSANLGLARSVLLMKDIGWLLSDCGDGVVDAGEQCDDGNQSNADCCTNACTYAPGTTVCRASAGQCDPEERCTGASGSCPGNTLSGAGVTCRASAGACDVAETCSGTGAACPADTFASSATICRASAGTCDVEERCTGASPACPGDGFALPTLVCRGAAGVCDVAESCSGAGAECPANVFASNAKTCRASAGECDVAEVCSGSASVCPADAFVGIGTPCTSDGETCTTDECDGDSPDCRHVANSVPCDDGLFCDGGDTCAAGTCSVHEGDPCAGPDGDADCAESCDEAANSCGGADPEASACDDGDECTVSDACTGGVCSGEPSPEPGCTTTTTTIPATTTTLANPTTTLADATTTTLEDQTTTTTVPDIVCGDANKDTKTTAGDALQILRAAVGTATCALDRCDFNGSGSLTAGDALAVLRLAVGQNVESRCPPSSQSVSTSTTTTTLGLED